MKVLFVVLGLPARGVGGGSIAVINQIRAVSFKNEVHVLSLQRDPPGSDSAGDFLRQLGVQTHCIDGKSPSLRRTKIGELVQAVSPKLIQVDSILTARILGDPRVYKTASILRAWDATWDVLGSAIRNSLPKPCSRLGRLAALARLRRPILLGRLQLWKRQELRIARRYNKVLCFSARDKQLFEDENVSVSVIGLPMEAQPHPHDPTPSDIFRITFVGGFSYYPNVDAAAHLLEDIIARIPARTEIKIHIVGANPPANVARHHDGKKVVVHGFVDRLGCIFSDTDVVAIPLRLGGGVKLKTMTALAHGIPTVCSPLAADGLDVADGEHLLIRHSPAEFASALLAIKDNRDHGRRLGEAGRRYIVEKHSFERVGVMMNSVYRDVAGRIQ